MNVNNVISAGLESAQRVSLIQKFGSDEDYGVVLRLEKLWIYVSHMDTPEF